jgi:hypothetical protein
LPEPVRKSMETKFRARFDRVRVHTDRVAAKASIALGARAFTAGEDIFFAEGVFAAGGDDLLTHIVQAQKDKPILRG